MPLCTYSCFIVALEGPMSPLLTAAPVAQDDDPYVRKTAAVCVAKLFDINPELVEDRGFLDTLKVLPASIAG